MESSLPSDNNGESKHRESNDPKQEGFLPYNVYNMHASYVYKRRKLRNSVALLSEDNCAGITNGSNTCNSGLNYGCTSWEKYEHYLNGIPSLPVNTSISVQLHQQKPVNAQASQADDNSHLVLPSQTTEAQEKSSNKPHKLSQRYNNVNDSCSSSKCIMEHELFSDVTCRAQPVGRLAGSSCSLANVSCARNSDDLASLVCKLCGLKDSLQKMLICDLCEEAWHLSCCKVKKLPVDEWYCHPCLSKKPKVVKYRFNMGFNNCLLGGFSDDDYFGKPLELNPTERDSLNCCSQSSSSGSTSNWLQCRGKVLRWTEGDEQGIVCGKWRRAPPLISQTDDWDCSCAVIWDPIHADCAVPQISVITFAHYAINGLCRFSFFAEISYRVSVLICLVSEWICTYIIV
ncbi:unnamed protein product [Spirodela intermedia]|uniref:Uncharacterized protein n=2 Tax=Spirodela intermedia TaxID=51605 RepID=A0A7I8JJV8_SPIIN|nr:unnamed protein product [Spirodela intermedia]CAA6670360.1 unnamed protein product [Spirodela intermedia]CAA7407420.1 unnamed protein product [Spirodela intermedia]